MNSTKMQIRVDVDDHIDANAELMARVEGVVEGALDGFQDRITCVSVYLSRQTAHIPGDRDMCCRMEALAGHIGPIGVSHEAMTLTEAIHTAAAKLARAVHTELGRHKPVESGGEEGAQDFGHLPSS